MDTLLQRKEWQTNHNLYCWKWNIEKIKSLILSTASCEKDEGNDSERKHGRGTSCLYQEVMWFSVIQSAKGCEINKHIFRTDLKVSGALFRVVIFALIWLNHGRTADSNWPNVTVGWNCTGKLKMQLNFSPRWILQCMALEWSFITSFSFSNNFRFL